MTPAEWSAFVERYRELSQEWERARGQADARSRCAQAQLKLISDAAMSLPAKGDVVPLIEAALLEAEIDSLEHRFILDVLRHRKQFPRRFLAAVVSGVLRHGTRDEHLIDVATNAYGGDAVVRELISIAKSRGLDAGVADFYVYCIQVRSRVNASLLEDLHQLTKK